MREIEEMREWVRNIRPELTEKQVNEIVRRNILRKYVPPILVCVFSIAAIVISVVSMLKL